MIKPAPAPSLKPPLGERDHVLGSAQAAIELVEYGDYQCPHCGKASVIVHRIIEEFGDKLRFGFRHFPLAKMHVYARGAALAAEAASAQGKFWEMHELLFQNGGALDPESLVKYAEETGLDVQRFQSELSADTYAPRVQEDVSSGVRSGVNGTPTFFINGKRHNGGYDYESLVSALSGF